MMIKTRLHVSLGGRERKREEKKGRNGERTVD